MINIFVIGEVLHIDRFKLINEYYSTVKNANFYYCLTTYYDLQLDNCIIVERQKSIYDYIKLIIAKYKFDDNDEIFINIAGCILFLDTKEFYQYDKSLECFNAKNYANIIFDDTGYDVNIEFDEIMKTGLEFFVEYNRSKLDIDICINGTYLKYYRLLDFLNNLKLDIVNCVRGEDYVLCGYIEKITDYTMINGFSFIDAYTLNKNHTSHIAKGILENISMFLQKDIKRLREESNKISSETIAINKRNIELLQEQEQLCIRRAEMQAQQNKFIADTIDLYSKKIVSDEYESDRLNKVINKFLEILRGTNLLTDDNKIIKSKMLNLCIKYIGLLSRISIISPNKEMNVLFYKVLEDLEHIVYEGYDTLYEENYETYNIKLLQIHEEIRKEIAAIHECTTKLERENGKLQIDIDDINKKIAAEGEYGLNRLKKVMNKFEELCENKDPSTEELNMRSKILSLGMRQIRLLTNMIKITSNEEVNDLYYKVLEDLEHVVYEGYDTLYEENFETYNIAFSLLKQ